MPTATHVVERRDVAAVEESRQSLMAEGILEGLATGEQRDLLAYMMSPTQVVRPE